MCFFFQLSQLYYITLAFLVRIFNGIPGILGGNTAHLPLSHKENIAKAKSFPRGFSEKLHNGCITITYWCDNNTVVFMDNDVPSGKAHWTTMEVRSKGDFEIMHVPLVASIYKRSELIRRLSI